MSFNFQVSLESKHLILGMATTEMALKRTLYASWRLSSAYLLEAYFGLCVSCSQLYSDVSFAPCSVVWSTEIFECARIVTTSSVPGVSILATSVASVGKQLTGSTAGGVKGGKVEGRCLIVTARTEQVMMQ